MLRASARYPPFWAAMEGSGVTRLRRAEQVVMRGCLMSGDVAGAHDGGWLHR